MRGSFQVPYVSEHQNLCSHLAVASAHHVPILGAWLTLEARR
jgi:hypothetical protein